MSEMRTQLNSSNKTGLQMKASSPNNWQGFYCLFYWWVLPPGCLLLLWLLYGLFDPILVNWQANGVVPPKPNPIWEIIGFIPSVSFSLVAFVAVLQLRRGALRVAITQTRFNKGLFVSTGFIMYSMLYGCALFTLVTVQTARIFRSDGVGGEGSKTIALIALFIAWVFIIVLATRWIRRIYREIDLVCPSCLYEREGRVDATVCPECGYTDPSFDNAKIDSV